MKKLAISLAVAMASGLTFAQMNAPKANDAVGNRSEAPHNATMPGTASDHWKQHSKGGYMTKDQAMGYKMEGGKKMDWTKVDTDNDGKVSQSEWSKYHGGDSSMGGATSGDQVKNRSEAPMNKTMPKN